MKKITTKQILSFRRKLLRFYTLHGRNLPFRKTKDPYKIAISEIMLQQTQVDRVIPKWQAWKTTFPTWQALAKAKRIDVLKMWSGLGYNRRAKNVHDLAKRIVHDFNGKMPKDPKVLITLPGIGPYTANAVLIFAFNFPLVTIDTNIRRVLLHEFGLPASTSMKNIESLAQRVLPKTKSRDWHNALMDYSALVLPKRIMHIPPRTQQSTFKGSIREIRGEILRQLTTKQMVSKSAISHSMKRSDVDVQKAIDGLKRDGLVNNPKGKIVLRAH